jgi:hypothetical protein
MQAVAATRAVLPAYNRSLAHGAVFARCALVGRRSRLGCLWSVSRALAVGEYHRFPPDRASRPSVELPRGVKSVDHPVLLAGGRLPSPFLGMGRRRAEA